jgi:hypothetical protein
MIVRRMKTNLISLTGQWTVRAGRREATAWTLLWKKMRSTRIMRMVEVRAVEKNSSVKITLTFWKHALCPIKYLPLLKRRRNPKLRRVLT